MLLPGDCTWKVRIYGVLRTCSSRGDIQENELPIVLVHEEEVPSTLNPWCHFKLVLILALCLGGLLYLGWFKVSATVRPTPLIECI
jgi:hypothetical protein